MNAKTPVYVQPYGSRTNLNKASAALIPGYNLRAPIFMQEGVPERDPNAVLNSGGAYPCDRLPNAQIPYPGSSGSTDGSNPYGSYAGMTSMTNPPTLTASSSLPGYQGCGRSVNDPASFGTSLNLTSAPVTTVQSEAAPFACPPAATVQYKSPFVRDTYMGFMPQESDHFMMLPIHRPATVAGPCGWPITAASAMSCGQQRF